MLTIAGSGINLYSLKELSQNVNWQEFDHIVADVNFDTPENKDLIPQNTNFLSLKETRAFIKDKRFLKNIPGFSYSDIAKAIGLKTYKIENNQNQKTAFRKALLKSLKLNKPVLIEIKAPSEKDAWHGVWTTEGNEAK